MNQFTGETNKQVAPRSTSNMIMDMMGLSEIYKVISDPNLMSQTHAMMAAVIDAAQSMRRLEAKIDRLLEEYGIDFAAGTGGPASVSAQHRPDGVGGYSVAGGVADHGTGGAAADHIAPGRDVAA